MSGTSPITSYTVNFNTNYTIVHSRIPGTSISGPRLSVGTINASSIMTGSVWFPPSKKRGWNGRHQSRCSGCARWAKALDAGTVECRRCLGEMKRW